jgi:uncharacterized protein YecE (DUF72 family)
VTRIFVGCCGFPTGRKKYYTLFNVVELQETFYNPPDVEKLAKLRQEAPEGFIFTLKAWQAITHPTDSPTWKKSKFKPREDHKDKYGYLKPTREVFEAWELTAEAAKTLKAKVVVLQMPPSFNASEENIRNAEDFFSAIETKDFVVGWELRGDWSQNPQNLRRVLEKFEHVVHVVDPFKALPVIERETTYFRLHGIGKGEVNYRYKYTDEDLEKLWNIVQRYAEKSTVYVMFNNVYMLQDAQTFMEKYLKNS